MAEELDDDALVAAVQRALDDDQRDLCAGGVAPPVLADRLGRTTGHVRRRCNRLVDAGRLVAVDGVDRETYQPRRGFLPAPDE